MCQKKLVAWLDKTFDNLLQSGISKILSLILSINMDETASLTFLTFTMIIKNKNKTPSSYTW